MSVKAKKRVYRIIKWRRIVIFIIVPCLIVAGIFLYLAFNQPKPEYTVFNTKSHELIFEGDYKENMDIQDYVDLFLYLELLQHNLSQLVKNINNKSITQTQIDLTLIALSNELNTKVRSLTRFTNFPIFNKLSQAFLTVQNHLRQSRQGDTARNLELATNAIKEFL